MNKKKPNKNIKITIIAAIFFILLFAGGLARKALAAAAFTDIQVCTGPPEADLTNPSRPKVNFTASGHNFYFYQVVVGRGSFNEDHNPPFSSVIYDSGIKSRTTSFSYVFAGGGGGGGACDIKILGTCYCYVAGGIAPCGGTPAGNGHLTPRCSCDHDDNNTECSTSGFNASAGDPDTCYDWYATTNNVGYTCSIDWETGRNNCACSVGGTCSVLSCTNPWDPSSPGCSCLDGTSCSSFTPTYDPNSGYYNYSCADNSCSSVTQYSNQFTKTGELVPIPPGTYSFEIPPGTLAIDNSTYSYAVRLKDSYDWSPYAQGSFTLGQIDGKCAQNLSFCETDTLSAKPPTDLCLIGAPVITNNSKPWSWTCSGYFGGKTSSQCCATPITQSQSSCGPAFSKTYCQGDPAPAASDLCAANNTATNFRGDGSSGNPWAWDCTNNDSCRTPTVSCTKTYTPKQDGQCGTLSGTNFCESGEPASNLCSPANSLVPGSLTPHYTEWTWKCGSTACGGTQVDCSAGNIRACGWTETSP